MFQTKLLLSNTHRNKKELKMNGKLQQKEIIIHEEAMYTFLIGPSLAPIAEHTAHARRRRF